MKHTSEYSEELQYKHELLNHFKNNVKQGVSEFTYSQLTSKVEELRVFLLTNSEDLLNLSLKEDGTLDLDGATRKHALRPFIFDNELRVDYFEHAHRMLGVDPKLVSPLLHLGMYAFLINRSSHQNPRSKCKEAKRTIQRAYNKRKLRDEVVDLCGSFADLHLLHRFPYRQVLQVLRKSVFDPGKHNHEEQDDLYAWLGKGQQNALTLYFELIQHLDFDAPHTGAYIDSAVLTELGIISLRADCKREQPQTQSRRRGGKYSSFQETLVRCGLVLPSFFCANPDNNTCAKTHLVPLTLTKDPIGHIESVVRLQVLGLNPKIKEEYKDVFKDAMSRVKDIVQTLSLEVKQSKSISKPAPTKTRKGVVPADKLRAFKQEQKQAKNIEVEAPLKAISDQERTWADVERESKRKQESAIESSIEISNEDFLNSLRQ